jgi:MYXO-CTERM domain-containing protein
VAVSSSDGAGLLGVGAFALVIAGLFELVARRRVLVGDLSRRQDHRRALAAGILGIALVAAGVWLIR